MSTIIIESKNRIIDLPSDVAIYLFEFFNFDSLSKLYQYEPDKNIIAYLNLLNNSFVKNYKIKAKFNDAVFPLTNKNYVQMLMNVESIDINEKNKYGQTVLFTAVQKKQFDIVNILLENKNIDVNIPNNDFKTPLYIAANLGHTNILLKLVDVPGIIFRPLSSFASWGCTPLYEAVYFGYLDIVRILLDKDSTCINDINYETSLTPLWLAVDEGQEEIVKLLLNKGADINIKNTDYGITPLFQAAYRDREKILKLFLDKRAIDDSTLKDLLYKSALKGYKNICNMILNTNKISSRYLDKIISRLRDENYLSDIHYLDEQLKIHRDIINLINDKCSQM